MAEVDDDAGVAAPPQQPPATCSYPEDTKNMKRKRRSWQPWGGSIKRLQARRESRHKKDVTA